MKLYFPLSALFFFITTIYLPAQNLVGDWIYHPNYTLNRNAENYPGNKIDPPKSKFEIIKTLGEPIYLYEQLPTQRLNNFLDNQKIPRNSFSVEFWLLNHVNLPVGTMMCLRNPKSKNEIPWLLGYYGDELVFQVTTEKSTRQVIREKVKRGWKKYWGHVVATFDESKMVLYLNGELLKEVKLAGQLNINELSQIELAGYFSNEPYMKISNLLKSSRLYEGVLSEVQIKDRFKTLSQLVEKGALFPDTLHFNAGPYLHYATKNSMNVLWETNYPTTAVIEYGPTLPMEQKIELNSSSYIQEVTIDGLEPSTIYYYQVTVKARGGEKMKSGVLTFGTAGDDAHPFSFCIIGDTESRPHVNHRLGEMIWEERPNFLLHLGDITDGGKEPHKFEWNYEYFTGILPVSSRIPVFPVPGNGEGDLYWYERYHRLPAPEAYYSFTYGNAEFFMLNSNASSELQKGGIQYNWLQQKLSESTAKWKFVAHHHCPISSDENDFGNTWNGEKSTKGDPKFNDLITLYEQAGVDVVFFGHVHAYERTYPMKGEMVDEKDGVVYLKSGGGGGNLEDFAPTHNLFSNKIQRGHHYCKVDVANNLFVLKMYDIEGKLKDIFELRK